MVVGSWEMVDGSWETNQVFNRAERVERVDGDESGFNAEKAEAQEAQRGEGGDFGRVDGGALRLDLDGGVVEESAMLNSANSPNLSSHPSHASSQISSVHTTVHA